MADDTKTAVKADPIADETKNAPKGWTVLMPLDLDGERFLVGDTLSVNGLKQGDAAMLIDIGAISAV